MFSPKVRRPVDAGFAIIKRAKPIVLGHKRVAQLVKSGAVRVGPPVAQLAGRIVFGSLIVKAMPDLVADHPANRAVIHRDISRGAEERLAQNSGWENDLILGRVVIGVDRLRQHEPFGSVDRLAELRDVIG